jgi:hypothetical protein
VEEGESVDEGEEGGRTNGKRENTALLDELDLRKISRSKILILGWRRYPRDHRMRKVEGRGERVMVAGFDESFNTEDAGTELYAKS